MCLRLCRAMVDIQLVIVPIFKFQSYILHCLLVDDMVDVITSQKVIDKFMIVQCTPRTSTYHEYSPVPCWEFPVQLRQIMGWDVLLLFDNYGCHVPRVDVSVPNGHGRGRRCYIYIIG